MLSLASRAVQFQGQLGELLDRLYDWVGERTSKISAAYFVLATDGITLVIVQKVVRFDFDLEGELTELDLEVANADQFSLVPFSTLLVPKVGDTVLKTFLSSGKIMQHTVNAEQE